MAGFDARKGVSTGVHDNLHASALVFEHNGVCAAIVSVEVITISRDFSAKVRKEIERITGIPAGNIVLSATHTHCGPVTQNHFFNQGQALDEQYLEWLAGEICEATQDAFAQRAPRRLRTGFARCEGIATNRRTADGHPFDPLAGILLVEEPNGNPYAVAVSFACHPTVLGPNTLEISEDFPFFTLEALRKQLGQGVEAMYFNGAEGDLSIGHKSDLSAVGIIEPYRNFETARRLGETLAGAVLAALPTLERETGPLSVQRITARLPLKQYAPSKQMTEARILAQKAMESASSLPLAEQLPTRQRSLFARMEEYYAILYEAESGESPKTLNTELTAIRLGETSLVTLPGEIFVAVALGIRERSPMARTMFLGLANDYIGYLPSEGAVVSAGYEVVASRVTADAWRTLQDAALDVLHRLKAEG
jgi:hypothetical protein